MLFQPSSLSRTAGVTFLQGFQYMKLCDITKHVNELRLPETMVQSTFGYPLFFAEAEGYKEECLRSKHGCGLKAGTRTGFAIRTVARLVIAAALQALTLEAAALQYGGSFSLENFPGGDFTVNHELPNAFSNASLIFSHFDGDANNGASIAGGVTFGTMHAFSHVGGTKDPASYFSSGFGVSFYDSIAIHGASSGFLRLNISLHGSVNKSSGPEDQAGGTFNLQTFTAGGGAITSSSGIGMNWSPGASPGVVVSQGGLFDSLGAALGIVPNSGGYTFQGQGTVLIPFNAGNFDLFFTLNTTAACRTACLATSDFGNTALIDGATILDAQMAVIPGAFLTSDSGYGYLAASGPPAGDVPEPASAILTAIGLGVLAWRYRCQSKSRPLSSRYGV